MLYLKQNQNLVYQIIFINPFLFLSMKENTGSNITKNQSNSDWICYNCSNLNYSFRRICNRCRSITRQQNHQCLQMQYLQIYYQQPYMQSDKRKPMQVNSKNINVNQHADLIKNNQMKQINRKQSCGNGEASENGERKNSDWSCYQGERKFMPLLDNAWEGLYSSGDLSQHKTLSESDKTREQDEEEYDNQDILHNFDLTFI